MAYQFVAYNTKGKVVKGHLAVDTDKAATDLLALAGYQVINLKPSVPFFDLDKWAESLYKVKPAEVVLLFRQLSMLLECGTNIGASLEMLQEQSGNRLLKKILRAIVTDVRGGVQLSVAMAKHPKIFPSVHCQLLGIGEQSGNLESVLNQVAAYIEKEEETSKQTKGALMMPGITAVIAVVVIGLLIGFVIPSFGTIYTALGAELPPTARMLISLGNFVKSNGLVLILSLVSFVGIVAMYTRTRRGKHQLDNLLLHLPLMGRVRLLNELSRCCRSMALLFQAGIPLSEVMPMVMKGCNSIMLADALMSVQLDMIKGDGISGPMSKNKLFLPMMVQMVKVGEETGSLDSTLQAVAKSYEAEANDRMHSIIGLIQPVMTIVIGSIVGLIALTLVSTMTAMYGSI